MIAWSTGSTIGTCSGSSSKWKILESPHSTAQIGNQHEPGRRFGCCVPPRYSGGRNGFSSCGCGGCWGGCCSCSRRGRRVMMRRRNEERFALGGGQDRVRASQERRKSNFFRVVRNGIFVLQNAAAVVTDLSLAARRSFGRRSVRHAVTGRRVEAKQLSADTFIFLLVSKNKFASEIRLLS